MQIELDATKFLTSLTIATTTPTLWARQHTNCPSSTQNSLSATQIARSIRFTAAFS